MRVVTVLPLRGDRYVLAAVSGQSSSERRSCHEVRRCTFNARQIICQVSVSVRKAVSKVHLVFVILKRVRKRQRIVVPFATQVLSLEVILKVVDVSADSVPANLLFAAPFQARVAQYLHAVIVKRVWLS